MQYPSSEFESDPAEVAATPTRHRRPIRGVLCVGLSGLMIAWTALALTVTGLWDNSFCRVVFAVVCFAALALILIGIQYARGVEKGPTMVTLAFVLVATSILLYVLYFVILPQLKPPDRDDVLPRLKEKRGIGPQFDRHRIGTEIGTRAF